MKKHNFYAGPSIMSEFTIEKTADAVRNFAGMDLSIMEISHRSKEFVDVMETARQKLKDLLKIPEGYSVLFIGGGANLQFSMLAMNFLNTKAAYVDTGVWASRAIKEAKCFGEVDVIASSEDKNYSYIPKDFEVDNSYDYLHITTNNTIYGTEFKKDIDVSIPLIADMSSDILSRPVDISKYAMIYGGAQKNLAPSGLTFVIIREDIVGKSLKKLSAMLDYKNHIAKDSMYNTPPVLPVFSALQTMLWLESKGGVEGIFEQNKLKANNLYAEIDANPLFESTVSDIQDRSLMNVCFVMTPEYSALEKEFLDYAVSRDIIGIKGHRSVGGFRASIYNALAPESVDFLISVMREFKQLKG